MLMGDRADNIVGINGVGDVNGNEEACQSQDRKRDARSLLWRLWEKNELKRTDFYYG